MEVEEGVLDYMTKKYPVAEIFTSPQGEGLYAGTMMTFVRIAGCSVGKKLTDEDKQNLVPLDAHLPVYVEKCCTFDGRPFLCDTDFRTKEVLTVAEIIGRVQVGVQRLCITGGEPCVHDLLPLCSAAWHIGLSVHIETSGTILLKKYEDYAYEYKGRDKLWLTTSPKNGFLEENLKYVNEIKFLVDEHFAPQKAVELLYSVAARSSEQLVWVQPINDEFKVNQANVNRCLEIIRAHPRWRLSTQGHKIWNVR